MNRYIKSCVICCMLLVFFTSITAYGNSFKTIDAPGAPSKTTKCSQFGTFAYGVDGKNIVGYYGADCISESAHGFLYNGKKFTDINYPGISASTIASGISKNNIVGTYYDSSRKAHGFLYNGKNYTTIDYPGACRTSCRGIAGNIIVGYYEDTSGKTHGFLYDGSNYTPLNYPGSTLTCAYALSGSRILGQYMTNTGDRGFIYNGGKYTRINRQGEVRGISGTNIVGTYSGHGFLYNLKKSIAIDYPGAAWTFPYGISDKKIVGYYSNGGNKVHGFQTTIPTGAEAAEEE